MREIENIETQESLEAALQAASAILYKHSTVCGISAAALVEIRKFKEAHADVPVFLIDVRAHRQLSQHVADHLGIEHESPQAIIMQDGAPVWYGSHFDITASRLERELSID